MAELRFNPLTPDRVMIASHRQARPNMPRDYRPFCPGLGKVPDDFTVLKYDNDFPALRQEPRARHVVEECAKVQESVNVLKNGDLLRFGALMNASHDSLRDLYEGTGKELDALVSAARMQPGCKGSRMTGAGFGGCTISLVENEALEAFQENVKNAYTKKIGYAPSFYITDAGDGGRIL